MFNSVRHHILRVLRFEVLPKSQSKHYVHGFYVEAEETETWVKQVRMFEKCENFLKYVNGFS